MFLTMTGQSILTFSFLSLSDKGDRELGSGSFFCALRPVKRMVSQ